jgi:hypothetical protein
MTCLSCRAASMSSRAAYMSSRVAYMSSRAQRGICSSLFATVALVLAGPALAQAPGDLHLRRLLALPVGALPPAAILMPASRNHNYLVARVQGGRLTGSAGDRDAIGAGVDIQWRGGSAFGGTVGYQKNRCADPSECPDHVMVGGRARLNLITGGPTVAALIGDASATTTFGTELGVGYAPNAFSGRNACAVDLAVPVSLSMFQVIRVVTFLSPGVAWDVRCPLRGGTPGVGASTLAAAGIGFHQLGARGLDVTLGAQRIFRRGAGTHLGISVTYTRLP